MFGSLVKALMGLISFGFLIFSGVLLYQGFGWLGFSLVILIAGGIVYVLIFVLGTPEPEGGWWIVRVELEGQAPPEVGTCFDLQTQTPENEPLVGVVLPQKAAFLVERQLQRLGQGAECQYELRLNAGVATCQAWAERLGQASGKKPKTGYVHYMVMELWRGGSLHWGGTASLERGGIELGPQINALLAALFDCLGRGLSQGVEEVPTREHDYVRLLQEEFGED